MRLVLRRPWGPQSGSFSCSSSGSRDAGRISSPVLRLGLGSGTVEVDVEILAAQCWLKRIIIYPRIPNCRFQKESSFDPPSRPTPLRHRRSIRLWPSAACRNRIALYCYKSILIYSACGSETSQWLVTDWSFHPMSETQTGPKFCNFRLCVCVCLFVMFLLFSPFVFLSNIEMFVVSIFWLEFLSFSMLIESSSPFLRFPWLSDTFAFISAYCALF